MIECEFEFICDQKWINLKATENDRVRFCERCNKNVTICYDLTELDQCRKAQECVCFFSMVKMVTGLPKSSNN